MFTRAGKKAHLVKMLMFQIFIINFPENFFFKLHLNIMVEEIYFELHHYFAIRRLYTHN